MRYILRYILLTNAFIVLFLAEGVSQLREDYEYTREFIYGINKNTNGGLVGGFVLKYGMLIAEDQFQSFSLELANVKHAKEFRYTFIATNPFIWGKSHYLYAIRPQYGREWIIFKKAPRQGVQVSTILAGGPTIGLRTPYFIEYGDTHLDTEKVAFDPEVHTDINKVYGTGNLFQGLGDSEVNLGLNVKASLSFELGTFKYDVTGFEIGFMLETYGKSMVLIPATNNNHTFTSLFVTLFYGQRK